MYAFPQIPLGNSIWFFFFFFFLFGPFKNIPLISGRSFIKGGRKPENHLTIRKQNLAFQHVVERGSNLSGEDSIWSIK